MQITNRPLVSPPIITNHTPPTNSPYQLSTLCVNVKPQPYTFLNPLDTIKVGPFFPFILLTPIVTFNQTPQPTPISSKHMKPQHKKLEENLSIPTIWL
jgi:hypothetical protein